jgi:hypothetical protein
MARPRPDVSDRDSPRVRAVLPPSVFDSTLGIDLSIPANDNPNFGTVVAIWSGFTLSGERDRAAALPESAPSLIAPFRACC